jgi:Leucine-rich repeat (LRR) protein
LFIVFILSIFVHHNIVSVRSQCLEDQSSLLLQIFDDFSTVKLSTWNSSTDCCSWGGVTCNFNGHVIGLDLSGEGISGVINDSSALFGLHYLQHLNLASNNFQGQEMPTKFNKFANLSYLDLSFSGFIGHIPMEISNLTNLVILDLSDYHHYNQSLTMELLDLRMLVQNLSKLTQLYLDGVRISSKGNEWSRAFSSPFPNLRELSLRGCQLSGPIDSSLLNLRSLSVLYLGGNNLSSPVPEFLAKFSNLSSLMLYESNLHGTVPEKIFHMPSLKTLVLSHNDQLHGLLPEFYHNGSLQELDISYSSFSGIIPSSIGNLQYLESLYLAHNNFTGAIPSFTSLKRLTGLYLGGNKLNGSLSSTNWEELSNLKYLYLTGNSFSEEIPSSLFSASGLLQVDLSHNKFTGLQNDFLNLSSSQLFYLDLSCNQIHGRFPSWIWEMRNLKWLNVSHNFLVEVGKSPLFSKLLIVDFHANQIQGEIQVLPPSVQYIDYSNNNFTSVIPAVLFRFLNFTHSLFLSNNNIQGSIPHSICNKFLKALDLSNNSFNGTIPKCLFESSPRLSALKLSSNKLSGPMPDKFARNCHLEYLDLSGNLLEGKISRSMGNCLRLRFLNLGKNKLNDVFPVHLMNISALQVLGLQSNQLHGSIVCREKKGSWPNLHIISIASNNFRGELPESCLQNWVSLMMVRNSSSHPLGFSSQTFDEDGSLKTYQGFNFYLSFVTTTKGKERELPKIFTEYTSLDFSRNNFQGRMPKMIGELKELRILNLSYNALTGEIPASIGKLENLDSLDLSQNNLSGKIPSELASLTFLAYGDFSYNQLVGQIPTSTQLQSFPSSYFEGNPGLCGLPLETKCSKPNPLRKEPDDHLNSRSGIEWSFISIEMGFTFGLAVVILPITFSRRWRIHYYRHVERVLFKLLPRLDPRIYKSREIKVGNLQNLRRG